MKKIYIIILLNILINKILITSILKEKNLSKVENLEKIKNGEIKASKDFLNANIIGKKEILKDENGKNALMVFIEEFCKNLSKLDEISLAEIIIENSKKYNLSDIDSKGNNIFHYLVKENLALTLKKILKEEFDSNLKREILNLKFVINKEGISPIAMSIDKNLLQIAASLEINEINTLNRKIDNEDNTPLMRLMKTYPLGNSEIFKLFLNDKTFENLNLKKENKKAENLLLISIKANENLAQQFINLYNNNNKEYIDKINKNGKNALIISIKKNKRYIVEYLLNIGANPLKLTTHQGESPISIAIDLGNQEILEKILTKYPKILNEKINGKEDTPLIYAIEKEKENLIEFLLKHENIDFSILNSDRENALLKAIKKKRSDIVEKLIVSNASVENEAESNYLIIWAAHFGMEEAIEILLAADAPRDDTSIRISKKAVLSLGNLILSNILSSSMKEAFKNFISIGIVSKSKEQEEIKEIDIELAYKKIKEVALKGEWILKRQKYSSTTLQSYEEVINLFTEKLQRMKEKINLIIKKEKAESEGYILENKKMLFDILEKKNGEEIDSLKKIYKKINRLINFNLNGNEGLRNILIKKIRNKFFFNNFEKARNDINKENFKRLIIELKTKYSDFLKEKTKLEIMLKDIIIKIRKLKNPLTAY